MLPGEKCSQFKTNRAAMSFSLFQGKLKLALMYIRRHKGLPTCVKGLQMVHENHLRELIQERGNGKGKQMSSDSSKTETPATACALSGEEISSA